MVDSNQQLEELFQKQHERDQEVILEVEQNLKKIFPDEKQFEVVFDLYQQVYRLSNDVQELNHANIFLNSYVDSFHQILVGDDKMIAEEEFRQKASDSYHASLQTVMDINKGEGENSE